MNSDQLFDDNWYRVKNMKPRLAVDVDVRRHVYRRVPWYVLCRQSTGASHRLNARAFEVIGNLDGTVTVDAVWQRALASQGAEAPTQSELMTLLAQLHETDLLTTDRRLNAERMFAKGLERNHLEAKRRYLNPLYLRFPIFDPDLLLNRLIPMASALFNPVAACVWIGLLIVASVQLGSDVALLRYEFANFDFFSPVNGLAFFFLYPLMKLLHELSHGLAVKRFGGEVHEMGVALLILLPIPYVDASAAALFADKTQRMLVGAAGIMMELGLAAMAAVVWSVSAPGLLHDLAFMVAIIGGVSTVVFNGNPLLKFDGYYVLADALEIPNLADRSKQFVLQQCRSRLFGLDIQAVQAQDKREELWLLAYGLTSTIYRLVLMSTIAFMLSGRFFFFGVALALWVIGMLVCLPLWRFARFIFRQPRLPRGRAILVSAGLTALAFALLGGVPLPLNTATKGVVWLSENAIVRTTSMCEVTEVFAISGALVQSEDPLFRCSNEQLDTQRKVLQAQKDELTAKRAGLDVLERVQLQILDNQIASISVRQGRIEELLRDQLLVARTAGRFVLAGELLLNGQFLEQGDVAAYVVSPEARTIRVAVNEADFGNLALGIERVEVQFADAGGAGNPMTSRVLRQTPRAVYTVPSAALTTAGGGSLVADVKADDGRSVMQPVFDIELAWPEGASGTYVGGHVDVKFVHPSTPLADRFLAALQRAFLGHLNI